MVNMKFKSSSPECSKTRHFKQEFDKTQDF